MQAQCSIPGCDRPVTARTLCHTHYERWRRGIEPLTAPIGKLGSKLVTLESRFWTKVNKDGPIVHQDLGPCWIYTGALGRKDHGYGMVSFPAETTSGHTTHGAHRVAWALVNGPIPDGVLVLHQCDNPPCCNPSHLFLGTDADNAADREAKGRRRKLVGEEHWNAKLTTSQVKEIREYWALGGISQYQLAEQYSMSKAQILRIVRGKNWS